MRKSSWRLLSYHSNIAKKWQWFRVKSRSRPTEKVGGKKRKWVGVSEVFWNGRTEWMWGLKDRKLIRWILGFLVEQLDGWWCPLLKWVVQITEISFFMFCIQAHLKVTKDIHSHCQIQWIPWSVHTLHLTQLKLHTLFPRQHSSASLT